MIPAGDTWEVEVEAAHFLLAKEGEAAFRAEMAKLGFEPDEIDRFVDLDRATAASTDPEWPAKCRRTLR